ncbi:hypothetical protein H0H87_009158 [Tephrocybe sp. NHM501043]|nr:hypothetical protein H0H87_009158 [Tephrocybe sp. NHM501043]
MVQHAIDPIPEATLHNHRPSSRILQTLLPFRHGAPTSPKLKGSSLFRKGSSALEIPVHNSRNRRSHANDLMNSKPNPKKATFQWVKGELLGKGSYAKVFLGLNASTGEIMAVKQVELPQTPSDIANSRHQEIAEALKLERKTLMGLDHPNVVQYLGYEENPSYLSIFLEYVPGGTISSCLQSHGIFSEEVTKSFTHQILEGLHYLHCMGIIHRDLKSDNILVEPSGICKITDFGISKQFEDISKARAYTGLRGTIFWMAPEILDAEGNRKGYDVKVDIWSIGCVVLEMWTGKRPWFGEELFPVMLKLSQEKLPPPIPAHLILTEHAVDFRRQCFQSEPQNRPSAAKLQTHQYLKLPPNWRFDAFELAPLQRSRSQSSRISRPSDRYIQPSSSNTSKVIPSVPPILTITGNSTYQPAGESAQIETLRASLHHQPNSTHVSDSGPPVVIITPPSSPLPQIAQLPNSNSMTSLDAAGSVSTPLKGFRVVNPDPEQHASGKPFVYYPPPLPSVDTSSPFSSRLLPITTHGADEEYPPSLREKLPTTPHSSRRNAGSRHSNHRRTRASQALSDYHGSDYDDEIWAVRPADLLNRGEPSRRARSSSRTRGPSRDINGIDAHDEWCRPIPAAVYENLQDFFPEYDLEKAVVPIASPNALTPEREEDRKKSILVVAADRAQSGARRRTKLWDSKVEELLM